MSEQEIKDIWMNAGDGDTIDFDLPQLVTNLKGKMNKINRTLFFRDGREILVTVLGMCFFSYETITNTGSLVKIASAMFVVWGGYVIYKLLDVRKYKKQVNLNQSFKSQLIQQRTYIEAQSHLLNSTWSWYAGPLGVIMLMYVSGKLFLEFPWWMIIICVLINAGPVYLLSWGVVALNKWAAKESFDPILENINRVLFQLEEEAIA